MTTPRHLTTARLIAAYTRGVQRAVEENRSRPARERERDRRHQLAGVERWKR